MEFPELIIKCDKDIPLGTIILQDKNGDEMARIENIDPETKWIKRWLLKWSKRLRSNEK